MTVLFTPVTLRGITVPNRVWVSPMCQYSSVEGHPTDWHLVHLGAFARGGAGLVMTEATAVSAEGRISPEDAGIWTDAQADDYRRITAFIRAQGSVAGIQLAHAGRKASTYAPWRGRGSVPVADGGWPSVGPSELAYTGYAAPVALTVEDISTLIRQWAAAAVRAVDAGFEVLEIHAAHGYLLHEFLSPLSNSRTDSYGGSASNRARLLYEIVDAVRAVIPEHLPLLVRVSASDWVPGGLTVDDVATAAQDLTAHGVDLLDVSSGGNCADQQIPVGPGYQVPFARTLRAHLAMPVAAVGLITEPAQAETILTDAAADAVFLARALLREPTWPQRAARELGADLSAPHQYERAFPRPR